jgi:hypothetical protein
MNRMANRSLITATLLLAIGTAISGCATLQQIAALRRVDFTIDRVTEGRVAGVALERISSYRDLNATDAAAVGLSLLRGELPFSFTLRLSALNPADNNVTARLVQMDWTLLLEDRETVSGRIDREFQFAPGVATEVPINISLDLADFFERNAADMIELALAVTGNGGTPKRVALRATPTIQTPIGPIRYPEPITIVTRTIGGGER